MTETSAHIAADGALAGLLPLFANATVLVLGDVMLDRYVHRRGAAHLARGADPGAARAGPALGARRRRKRRPERFCARRTGPIVGVVGLDEAGAEIGRTLAATPGITACLVATPIRPTTVKTRFVSGSHQLLRLDEEETAPIDETTEARLIAEFEIALARADVVVLSDYAKGVLTDRVLARVIALARAARKPVIADPKRAEFSAYRGVDVLTPNEQEAARATGVACDDDEGAVLAGERRWRRPRPAPCW